MDTITEDLRQTERPYEVAPCLISCYVARLPLPCLFSRISEVVMVTVKRVLIATPLPLFVEHDNENVLLISTVTVE